MTEEQFISINVWLAGRSYRIRIRPREEESVRKAVKLADEQVAELRNTYAGKDDQDFIAMCLLMYAADSVMDSSEHPLVKSELEQIIRKVDTALGNPGVLHTDGQNSGNA